MMTSSTAFCNASSEFVTVDGARMHYLRAGSGPPLLLLHGLVGSSCSWKRNVDGLAEHFTVYALDMIGMGSSERVAGGDADMRTKAAHVASFLDALGIESATIAAHSHGGAVSMMFTSLWPERVRALVLAAPANPYSCASDGLLRFYLSGFGQWFARFIPRFPRWVLNLALENMYGDPARIKDDVLGGYVECLRVPGTVDHILNVLRSWSADMQQLRKALKNGKTQGRPILMVWGDRDRAVPVESGQRLHSRLGDAQMVVLQGVGHLPFEEMPEHCNSILLEWARAEGLTAMPVQSVKPAQISARSGYVDCLIREASFILPTSSYPRGPSETTAMGVMDRNTAPVPASKDPAEAAVRNHVPTILFSILAIMVVAVIVGIFVAHVFPHSTGPAAPDATHSRATPLAH